MSICYMCLGNFPSIKAVVTHMKVDHKLHPSSTFRCKEGACLRSFTNLNTFKQHLARKHSCILNRHIENAVIERQEPLDNHQRINDEHDDQVECHPGIDFYKSIGHNALVLVSKLYSKSNIPRSHVQDMISDTSNFLSSGFVHALKEEVFDLLGNNVQFNHDELGKKFDLLASPFDNLSTECQHFAKLKELGYLIEPLEYLIDSRLDDKTDANGNTVYENVDFKGHFIPLRVVFKKYFEMPNVLMDTLAYMEDLSLNKDIISNFVQSPLWKEKRSKFSEDDTVLPLFLYFDDYETCNPLGTSAGIHKLGAAYVSIPSIPIEFQSTLDNIFLALLFHSSDREKTEYGNLRVFKKLIDELNYLEMKGIIVSTPQGNKTVFFVLDLILGDNLGLHSILGFVEGFTANYPCRFCRVQKADLISQTVSNPQLVRTVRNYETDLGLDDPSATGVKHKCVFNLINSFHVTSNYSVDIMHDLLEGVCSYDLQKILSYLILDRKFLTLDTLNFRINMVNYGHTERSNRPPCISRGNLDNCLRTSSSEMLCLIRYLGVMVGDLVPQNDRVWELYILIRKKVCLLMAKDIQKNVSCLLKTLIAEHHKLYSTLFGDTLKPKFHHMVHYDMIFDLVGPLVNTWSMRYESKHKESKTTATVSICRKNITHTLALKHQLKFAHRLLCNLGLVKDLEMGPGEQAEISHLQNYRSFADTLPASLKETDLCYLTSWVNIRSTKYKERDIIISGLVDDCPQFDSISSIIVVRGNVYFITQLYTTYGFDHHVQAYQVEVSELYQILSYKSLKHSWPTFVSLMADGKSYIALRSEL